MLTSKRKLFKLFFVSLLSMTLLAPSTACSKNSENGEFESLVSQYFQYWAENDTAGMQSLMSSDGIMWDAKPLQGAIDEIKIIELKDITPSDKEFDNYTGFLATKYQKGLYKKFTVFYEIISSSDPNMNLESFITVGFKRETETSPWKIYEFGI